MFPPVDTMTIQSVCITFVKHFLLLTFSMCSVFLQSPDAQHQSKPIYSQCNMHRLIWTKILRTLQNLMDRNLRSQCEIANLPAARKWWPGLCTRYIIISVFINQYSIQYIMSTTCDTSFWYFAMNKFLETFQNMTKIFLYACWKLRFHQNNMPKYDKAF